MLSKLAMCCFSDFSSEKLFGIIPISYVVSFSARGISLRSNISPRTGSTVEIESLPPSSKSGKIKFGFQRSEERRVGKECRSRWSQYDSTRKIIHRQED